MIENKLKQFFKKRNIKNKVISAQTGYSETMVSRYLKNPNLNFIKSLVKFYPDIDLNYLFKVHTKLKSESDIHQNNVEELIETIEKAIEKLKLTLPK